jgi:hypothetical protein
MEPVHSSLEAAIVVGGAFVVIVTPILWWIFKHDGYDARDSEESKRFCSRMNKEDITNIETSLNVKLDSGLIKFLTSPREVNNPDETAVSDDANFIIEATLEHRKGFASLKPWPVNYIYLGDEADACPYVYDSQEKKVFQLHKGNIERPPLKKFGSFRDFLSSYRKSMEDVPSEKEMRQNAIFYYVPLIVVLLLMFVVLPLIAYGITELWKWLF